MKDQKDTVHCLLSEEYLEWQMKPETSGENQDGQKFSVLVCSAANTWCRSE